jgi:mRNA-degrading endonuclease RelE of RelBE toxin-antitoxin system
MTPAVWEKLLFAPTLSGLWRYRIGDYRILCRIEDEKIFEIPYRAFL